MPSPVPPLGAARAEASIEERFAAVLRNFLEALGGERAGRALSPQASLERDLGLGSLEKVELLSRVESEFGVGLPDSVLAEAETVADVLAALLEAEGRGAAERVDSSLVTAFTALEVPERASNLLEALWAHVDADGRRTHVYLRTEDGTEQAISFAALAGRASRVAVELRERGVGAGDRVALMLPTGEDFFYTFLGVLLAEAIPVPIYPPARADRIEEFATRQIAILRNAEASMLVMIGRGETLGRLLRPAVPSLADVVGAERLWSDSSGSRGVLSAVPSGGAAPALIQYTSGSTGDPKGVLLTHANLLANIRATGRALGIRPNDSGVCWLPLYHDMGLIGCWLQSLYFGIPLTVMSPLAFLSRPERWLWAIHYHRATLSVGPNFAYDLCARRIPEESIEGLDLSSWRTALNGSEPVLPETIARFTSRFGRYGFRAEAMLPVYGLAESTVALCVPPPGRPPRVDRIRRDISETLRRAEPASEREPALSFVAVGPPLAEHEVRIVGDEGQLAGERVEGRIQFRGPSSMSGYFRQPEATAAIAHGDWLDSGDLGYWAGGDLFVTGRSKDVILKAGRNLYPQEIEAAVAEVAGIRKGCVAAFGVTDPSQGTEKLVVAAETREQDPAKKDQLRRAVRDRVLEVLGVPADEVALLAPGALPKTSSGKLRRAAARHAYEQGALARRRAPASLQWLRLALRSVRETLGGAARGVLRGAYSVYFWSVFVSLLFPCWLLLWFTASGRRSASVMRFFSRLFLRLAGIRLDVEGLEHLPSGPAMLVSNHASYLDAVIWIAALPRHFCYVAKNEVQSMPVLRHFARKARYLMVDRYSTLEGVSDTDRLEQALAGGETILVFPEGTFTRARGLRPFKMGAFQTAAASGRPVVPMAIQGSRSVLPDETWLVRRAPVKAIIRPAIEPAGSGWDVAVTSRDTAFAEILAHCGEPRLQIASAAIPTPGEKRIR